MGRGGVGWDGEASAMVSGGKRMVGGRSSRAEWGALGGGKGSQRVAGGTGWVVGVRDGWVGVRGGERVGRREGRNVVWRWGASRGGGGGTRNGNNEKGGSVMVVGIWCGGLGTA